MACDCTSYQCLEAKFNPCSDGAELAIPATETGTWSASIEFNGMWTDFNFGVVSGQNIVIPTQFLNELYVHQAKFFNGAGVLVGDTCYSLSARATQNAGIYAPIPPDTLAQILQDIAELQGDINTIDGELTTIEGEIATLNTDVSGLETDVSGLQTDVSTIQTEIDAIEAALADCNFVITIPSDGNSFTDSRMLNQTVFSITTNGQEYLDDLWTKPEASDTLSSTVLTFTTGQRVGVTLDL